MANDVQPIAGTSARVAARLCNFPTGHSTLLPAHIAWLDSQVKPVVTSSPNPWVDLIGYASRLGSSAANQRHSQERCDAVRARIATYSANVTFPQDYGVGESKSTGNADDNSGYWRAVDVLVYGAKPDVRPTPPKRYLIVFKAFARVVPEALQDSVKKTITDELAQFDVDLDFEGKRPPRDLTVTFANDIPGLRIFAESSRPDINGEFLSGTSDVYVRMMRMMRLQISATACEPTFLESEDSLGSLIANVTIHEIGHMLGMQSGGFDDGGHTANPDNYMLDPGTLPGPPTLLSPFEYVVRKGDTLVGIVQRHSAGTLDKCRIGPTDLTVAQVWGFPENKKTGFVGDPGKGRGTGKRANDPNSIYPSEKVALPCNNLRKQPYRLTSSAMLGKKTFTVDQIDTMKAFIAQRIAAGKG